MAATTNNSIRVRLYFDYPPPAAIDCRMCWLLVDLDRCRVVADLESIIKEKFEFSRRNILNLFIEDCYVPHTENIYVVRDNDSIRVKVDSLTQVNGHSSHPDASVDNSRKRLRQSEDDEPAENGVSVEWKKIKRKKKSDESIEKETERTLGDEQDKNSQRKRKKQKKKKRKAAEENGPAVTPKPTTSAKKDPTNVGQPIKSTKKDDEAPKKTPAAKRVPKMPSSTPAPSKLPATKPHLRPSSSETDSSSDEGPGKATSKSLPKNTPLKTPAAKLLPKTPSSTPAPSKVPPSAKLPATKPHPHPSSSETESSSDEGPGKATSKILLKKTPLAKPITSTSRPQLSPSAPQPANYSQKRAAGRASLPAEKVVEQPESSESEEEIKLVIRRPVQRLAPARSQPPWQARGRGMAWRGGGRGERGRGEGRGGGSGQSGIQFNYNLGQQAEQTSYQNDVLTNNSVVLQNGVETAPVRDYGSMPLLAAPPQVGQKIAFKLLELTENYTPEVSEYKEGKIMSFDLTTKQIELELLRASQAPVEPGKFDLVYQNEDGSERVEYAVTRGSWVTERWDSLLEPRLVI